MDCSTPGFPVHYKLPELAQTQVHQTGDAIQTLHPLSAPSSPAFNLSQHQGLFHWVNSSHQVAKVLELQLQHQSFHCSNSSPSNWWCHPNTSSSVGPFSSRFQSFPASRSFPLSQLFTSRGQNTGASSSASIFPMNIQDWFPLGWTSWIALKSKGFSRVFSNTTVQKHQFFCAQFSF